MKITRKLLKRMIQESLGSKSHSTEVEDPFKAYQEALEDKFEQASQNEPVGQATMMRDFERMLVAQNPHAAEVFMMAIHDDPKYVGQFFDFSRGRIELKGIHLNDISRERAQQIIYIARSYGESDPIFGRVIKNENDLKEVEYYIGDGSFDQLYDVAMRFGGIHNYAEMIAKEVEEEATQIDFLSHLNPAHVYDTAYRYIYNGLRNIDDSNP